MKEDKAHVPSFECMDCTDKQILIKAAPKTVNLCDKHLYKENELGKQIFYLGQSVS